MACSADKKIVLKIELHKHDPAVKVPQKMLFVSNSAQPDSFTPADMHGHVVLVLCITVDRDM